MGLLTALMERDVDALMTEKIKSFTGCPFAGNDKTLVFGEVSELNGFRFLGIQLVGYPRERTYKGCKIVFSGNDLEIKLDSDTMEIDTDYSDRLRMGITAFEMDLDEELQEAATAKHITQMQVIFGKTVYTFQVDAEKFYRIVKGQVREEDRFRPLG